MALQWVHKIIITIINKTILTRISEGEKARRIKVDWSRSEIWKITATARQQWHGSPKAEEKWESEQHGGHIVEEKKRKQLGWKSWNETKPVASKPEQTGESALQPYGGPFNVKRIDEVRWRRFVTPFIAALPHRLLFHETFKQT